MVGVPVRVTPLPPTFTVKALFARFAAAARVSSKVITSAVPSTAADSNAGASVSAVLLVTVSSVKSAVSLPAASSRRLLSSVVGFS